MCRWCEAVRGRQAYLCPSRDLEVPLTLGHVLVGPHKLQQVDALRQTLLHFRVFKVPAALVLAHEHDALQGCVLNQILPEDLLDFTQSEVEALAHQPKIGPREAEADDEH